MGRKPILPSQRAQPISFSLKPHLIEKIDDYAADLRFSRSKFLMEAVTQYILKADMGYMASSNNINDMTLAQKVAVGLAALQEANREGQTISKSVMDALRRELNNGRKIIEAWNIEWTKREAGVYVCNGSYKIDGQYSAWHMIATVRKVGSQWAIDGDNDDRRYKTLAAAKVPAEKEGKVYTQVMLNQWRA